VTPIPILRKQHALPRLLVTQRGDVGHDGDVLARCELGDPISRVNGLEVKVGDFLGRIVLLGNFERSEPFPSAVSHSVVVDAPFRVDEDLVCEFPAFDIRYAREGRPHTLAKFQYPLVQASPISGVTASPRISTIAWMRCRATTAYWSGVTCSEACLWAMRKTVGKRGVRSWMWTA
jgi:hypothetical protein